MQLLDIARHSRAANIASKLMSLTFAPRHPGDNNPQYLTSNVCAPRPTTTTNARTNILLLLIIIDISPYDDHITFSQSHIQHAIFFPNRLLDCNQQPSPSSLHRNDTFIIYNAPSEVGQRSNDSSFSNRCSVYFKYTLINTRQRTFNSSRQQHKSTLFFLALAKSRSLRNLSLSLFANINVLVKGVFAKFSKYVGKTIRYT